MDEEKEEAPSPELICNIEIINCSAQSDNHSALLIGGTEEVDYTKPETINHTTPPGKILVKNCLFYKSHNGIFFDEGPEATIMGCLSFNNLSNGFHLQGTDVDVAINTCVAAGNKGNGINFGGKIKGDTRGSFTNCFNNGCNGVAVSADAFATIENLHASFNMFGVLIWGKMENDISSAEFQQVCSSQIKELEDNNELLYNTVGGAHVKGLPDGTTLVELANKDQVCTFAYTATVYYEQEWFYCMTCGLVGQFGLCKNCAEVHEKSGHEVVYNSIQQAYCDCGSEKTCPNGFVCTFRGDVAEKQKEH